MTLGKDPGCEKRSGMKAADWKVSSLPIHPIQPKDAYATVTAPYVDVDVPHGFDEATFARVTMASLLYEDEQLVGATCGSSDTQTLRKGADGTTGHRPRAAQEPHRRRGAMGDDRRQSLQRRRQAG